MFVTDRDLLAIEPGLLRMVGWLGQTVSRSSAASIDGAGLLLTASDGGFVVGGVGTGHIVLAGETAYEVLSAPSATQLLISRMRASADDAAIPGESGSGLTMSVVSFRPQIGIAHRQILRMAGIQEEPGIGAGAVTEGMITNGGALRLLESTLALKLVFESAMTGVDRDDTLRRKAFRFGDLFEQERQRVRVEIDLDGDGEADAARSVSMFRMARA